MVYDLFDLGILSFVFLVVFSVTVGALWGGFSGRHPTPVNWWGFLGFTVL
jgi:hypothetical protein